MEFTDHLTKCSMCQILLCFISRISGHFSRKTSIYDPKKNWY